jgi:hypothetical protein
MFTVFYSRVLVSIADSIFWIMIIWGLCLAIWFLIYKTTNHLTEEITKETEDGESIPIKKESISKTKKIISFIYHYFKRKE